MASATKERVGIVGVGRMGLAMLKHLVKHGYPVTACDLDDKQWAKARVAGATTVKTPAEVARAADFVIIGVGYDDEVNAVVLGADGLLADLAPGSIIAVSSTAKPDTRTTRAGAGRGRARRTDLPRTFRGGRGNAAGAGRRQGRRGRARARGLRLL